MRNLLFLLLMTSFSVQASITIGAYNIRNFDYDERYRIHTDKGELASIIKSLNVDVLSVEEIGNTEAFESFIANKFPGYDTELSRCGGRGGHKLGFVYNTSKVELLSFHEDLSVTNPGGEGGCEVSSRPLAIGLFRIKATGKRFYGITAHLKAGSHPNAVEKRHMQLEIVKDLVNELRRNTGVQDFYIAGDLNTTLYYGNGPDAIFLNKIAKNMGMEVLTQNLPCSAYWWGGTDDGIETPSLLDHVLVSSTMIRNRDVQRNTRTQVFGHCAAARCQQVPESNLGLSYARVSDHCPVAATILQ
jgi:hypothetical protein